MGRPSTPCVGDNGDALHLQIVYNKKKKFSLKKKDLGMACHTLPLKKSKETRGNAITQPRTDPITINVEFRDGMGHDM